MKKLSLEDVKRTIEQFPEDRFSFPDILAAVAMDYEQVKDLIFELLAEPNPNLKQVFDAKLGEMRFQRITS